MGNKQGRHESQEGEAEDQQSQEQEHGFLQVEESEGNLPSVVEQGELRLWHKEKADTTLKLLLLVFFPLSSERRPGRRQRARSSAPCCFRGSR